MCRVSPGDCFAIGEQSSPLSLSIWHQSYQKLHSCWHICSKSLTEFLFCLELWWGCEINVVLCYNNSHVETGNLKRAKSWRKIRPNLKQIKLLILPALNSGWFNCRHHRHHSFQHSFECSSMRQGIWASSEQCRRLCETETGGWIRKILQAEQSIPPRLSCSCLHPANCNILPLSIPLKMLNCMWQDPGMARAPHRGRANPKPSGWSWWDWKTMSRRSNQMIEQTIKRKK